VVRTIHVEDGVASPLEILPILAPERMAELLARELEALGFVRDGSTCRRTEPDGIEVAVDLERSMIAVKLGAAAQLGAAVELSAHTAIETQGAMEARLRDDAIRQLDDELDVQRAVLQRAVTAQLEAKLADLQRELDGAVGRATIGALTEKAAQLGRIEETHLDAAGNLTIRVRL